MGGLYSAFRRINTALRRRPRLFVLFSFIVILSETATKFYILYSMIIVYGLFIVILFETATKFNISCVNLFYFPSLISQFFIYCAIKINNIGWGNRKLYRLLHRRQDYPAAENCYQKVVIEEIAALKSWGTLPSVSAARVQR